MLGTAGGAGVIQAEEVQDRTASAKALRCEVTQSIWGELSNLVHLGVRNRRVPRYLSVCKKQGGGSFKAEGNKTGKVGRAEL